MPAEVANSVSASARAWDRGPTLGSRAFASPKSRTSRAVAGQLYVGGLQVAVHDSLLERVRDLARDSQRFTERDRPHRDALRQRRPPDQFHHEVVRAYVVERADV